MNDIISDVPDVADVPADGLEVGVDAWTAGVGDQSGLDEMLDATFPDGSDIVGETEVSGFDESDLTTNKDVGSYLETTIPPGHLQGLDAIKYVDDQQAYAEGLMGLWQSDPVEGISVSVYPHDNAGEMYDTIAHEVGHNAEEQIAAAEPELIDQWTQVYDQTSTELVRSGGAHNEFVTPYAETSPEEDFAESYATYLNDPDYLKAVSVQKFDFMDLFVFARR